MLIQSRKLASWIAGRAPRSRCPHAGCFLQLETLENRTPLSSGLQAGLEAAVLAGAAEVGVSLGGRPPVAEWAILAVAEITQALSPPDSASAFPTAPALESSAPPPAPPPLAALVEFLESGPTAAATADPHLLAVLDGGTTVSAPSQLGAVGGAIVTASGGLPGTPDVFKNAPPPVQFSEAIAEAQSEYPQLSEMSPFPFGPVPWHPTSQSTSNDSESDISFTGTLEDIEAIEDSSAATTTPVSAGQFTGRSWNVILREPLEQISASGETLGTSGLAYLATASGPSLDSDLSANLVDGVLAWEDALTEPAVPASIMAGGVSVNVLLGGINAPATPDSRGLEQVAELVPLSETSLALAATLWTRSSEIAVPQPGSRSPDVEPSDSVVSPAAVSAWAVFVTGMDEALEQTCRDLREGIPSGRVRGLQNERPGFGRQNQIQWQGPILPAARIGLPRHATPKLPRESKNHAMNAHDAADSAAADARGVVKGAVPVISVASISTMIAGWFWSKRKRSAWLGAPSASRLDRMPRSKRG